MPPAHRAAPTAPGFAGSMAGREAQVCRRAHAWLIASICHEFHSRVTMGKATAGHHWGLWKEEGAAPLSGGSLFGLCLLLLQHRNCTQGGLCLYMKNTSKRSCLLRGGFLSCLPPPPPARCRVCCVTKSKRFRNPEGTALVPYLSLMSWIFCSGLCFCWICWSCR